MHLRLNTRQGLWATEFPYVRDQAYVELWKRLFRICICQTNSFLELQQKLSLPCSSTSRSLLNEMNADADAPGGSTATAEEDFARRTRRSALPLLTITASQANR